MWRRFTIGIEAEIDPNFYQYWVVEENWVVDVK